jgi:antitoxin StbD
MAKMSQTSTAPPTVLSASEARVSLPAVLDDFRDHGLASNPVFFGSHRKAEGVIIPVDLFYALIPAIDEVLLKENVRKRLSNSSEGVDLDTAFVASLGLDPADFNL